MPSGSKVEDPDKVMPGGGGAAFYFRKLVLVCMGFVSCVTLVKLVSCYSGTARDAVTDVDADAAIGFIRPADLISNFRDILYQSGNKMKTFILTEL